MALPNSQEGFIVPSNEQFRDEAVNVVTKSGMMREDHWRFASGMHAAVKADFDFAAENPDSLMEVAAMMSAQVIEAVRLNDLPTPDVVVGVPSGAETLADKIIPQLEEAFDKDISQVYVSKFPGFRPVRFWVTDPEEQTVALENHDGEQVHILGVEDVTTTWNSTRGAMRAVIAAGKNFHPGKLVIPMGMVSFAERQGSERDQYGDPIRLNVVDLFVNQWPQEECNDCTNGVPMAQSVGQPATREVVQQILQGWPEAQT